MKLTPKPLHVVTPEDMEDEECAELDTGEETATAPPPAAAKAKKPTMAEIAAAKLAAQPPPPPADPKATGPKDLRGLHEAGRSEDIARLAAEAKPYTAPGEDGQPWVSYVSKNDGRPERVIDWRRYFEAGQVDLAETRGMDAEEIRDTLPPPIVHGVLRQGSTMILAGASKARKSWLALALALAVRTGGRFVGFRCEQARVRYVDLELKRNTGASRYALARLGLTDEPEIQAMIDEGFFYHSLRALPAEEGTAEGFAGWMKAEAQTGELWILDCLQPIMEVDQNDAVAVRGLMRCLMEAATATGAALVIIDHYNKSGDARGMARVSGSVAKVAAVDAILTLTPDRESDTIRVDLDLREDPPCEALAVRFNSHTHGFDVLDPDEAKREAERMEREQLAEWLATGWGDGSEARTRADLGAVWRMVSNSGALRERVKALLAAGMIREGKQGRSLIYEVATATSGNLWQVEATSPESLEALGKEVATGS